jgi:O-antigen ligase
LHYTWKAENADVRELSIHRFLPAVYGILILFAAAVAGYFDQPFWLLVPAGMVFILFSLQYPVILFYILLASIPWSIEYNFTPSLGTDLPDEPLMLLLAFASMALLVYKRNELRLQRIHFLVWILIIQLLWVIITVIFSTDQLLSVKYLLAKSWYLLAFVAAPLFLLKDERSIKRAAIVLATSMFLFTVLALYKHSVFNFSFAKINKALEPFYRNHVNYSALLVCIVPLVFAGIQFTRSRAIKNLLYLVMFILVVAIYFSFARGAWLALIAGWVAYWLIKKRLLFWAYIAAMMFTIGFVFYMKAGDRYLKYSHDYKTTIYHEKFSEHLAATYKLKDVSTAERYYRWIAGVRMARDSWMTGFGPNTFYNNYRGYTVPAFKTWVSVNEEKSTVHNYFLFLLIEQGVIGMFLFMFLVGAMFWYAQNIFLRSEDPFWKTTTAVCGILLVIVCVINFLSDLIESDKVGSIFFIVLAVLVIADRKTRNSNLEI